MNPPWQSKYTININTEMNYWPAESGNLAECVEPLIGMVNDLMVTGARTAHQMYGARGWVVHHNTDLWRASAPIDGPNWGMWPSGGVWLCLHLWDRYEFSADLADLQRIYPMLKGASEFFLDTLQEEPRHKWLVTNPSISPENGHPFGSAVCAGPTMDMQILRDLFANTIKAAATLGVDEDLRKQLATARARLAPNQIGSAGQLQEWLEDWDLKAGESITATFRTSTACIRAATSTVATPRSWRRRSRNRWKSGATRPPAGRRPGASACGRTWATAIMRSRF